MKSLTEHLWFNTPTQRAFVNITPQIEELVRQSGVREGLVLVNASPVQYLLPASSGVCGLRPLSLPARTLGSIAHP